MGGDDLWVPLGQREEWKDVTPVPQDDGPNPVCVIAYGDKFQDCMNFFRACLKSGEKSLRVLALLDDVIEVNAANYTAWYYRRQVLTAIGADLRKELDYVSELGRENPKNYQIWHHRQSVIERLQDASQELAYCAEQIEEDSKNYHAWGYRQWILKTFNLWANELAYVEELILKDFRNNSAWNHRYFVVSRDGWTAELRTREVEFAKGYCARAPNNQASWAYLTGVVGDLPSLKEWALAGLEHWILSPHPASLLVNIYFLENTADSRVAAIQLCAKLAEQLDKIRHKYWNYRRSEIEKRIE